MSKKKLALIGVITIVFIAIVLFVLVRRRKSAEELESATTGSGNGSATKWVTKGKDLDGEIDFPIQYGDSGTAVKYIQRALNDMHNAGLVEDGKFGSKTRAALKDAYNSDHLNAATFAMLKTLYEKWQKEQKQ